MSRSITFEPFNRAVIQFAVSDSWFYVDTADDVKAAREEEVEDEET
jgi:hypothetical protein